MKTKHISFWVVLVSAILLLAYSQLAAEAETKSVIGPRNVPLTDGANALISGDAEEGIRLTLRGLDLAQGDRELKAGHANLCAGYVLIYKPLTALQHCNWVLERDPEHWRTYNNRALAYLQLERFEESEADIARGQGLRPNSTNLKVVKGMLLDETDPVIPNVEVDERRGAMGEDNASEAKN